GQETRAPWPAARSPPAAAVHLPLLAHSRVETLRIGVRPMPPDKHPIVGAIAGLPGFYVVVSHSGVTLGPLWGRIAAAEILDGADDPPLPPDRPGRLLQWGCSRG